VDLREDGRGFDASQAAPTGHWGLITMRERAASVGAKLTSAPGAGTEVVIVLAERSGWSVLWRRLVRGSGSDRPGAP
jgi:nitrate/nitrite-specific signal transduction histidine kinase